jgi:hypothetical protein
MHEKYAVVTLELRNKSRIFLSHDTDRIGNELLGRGHKDT